LYVRNVSYPNKAEEIQKITRGIIEDLERNDDMRKEVLSSAASTPGNYNVSYALKNFIEKRVPIRLNYEIRICDSDRVCGLSQYIKKDVYVEEVIISTSIDVPEFSPKKVKLFLWEK
jgi:hypothetical protein